LIFSYNKPDSSRIEKRNGMLFSLCSRENLEKADALSLSLSPAERVRVLFKWRENKAATHGTAAWKIFLTPAHAKRDLSPKGQ
jgi:hypothetical protein